MKSADDVFFVAVQFAGSLRSLLGVGGTSMSSIHTTPEF